MTQPSSFSPQPSEEDLGGRAPARPSNRPDRGDAWEPLAEEEYPPDRFDDRDVGHVAERQPHDYAEGPDEDTPRDGRQLLGWASKQIPDMKGALLSYGKKHGLTSKTVGWTPEQVTRAYRHARRLQGQRRPSATG